VASDSPMCPGVDSAPKK